MSPRYSCCGNNEYERLDKRIARKLFNAGEPIYILPNKLRLDIPWVHPVLIQLGEHKDFDAYVDAFSYYYCNRYVGNKAAFYHKMLLND